MKVKKVKDSVTVMSRLMTPNDVNLYGTVHGGVILRMLDEPNKEVWQFGYYNKDDTITTFIADGESIKDAPEQEIFKEDAHILEKLDMDKAEIEFEDALDKSMELQKKEYSMHPPVKIIAILQTLGGKTVFNITMISRTMNALNFHVNASSGKIEKKSLVSIMEFAKFDNGERPSYIG